MTKLKIEFAPEELDFVMQVLQTQPLPFVRTAPILSSIGGQLQAQQKASETPEFTKVSEA